MKHKLNDELTSADIASLYMTVMLNLQAYRSRCFWENQILKRVRQGFDIDFAQLTRDELVEIYLVALASLQLAKETQAKRQALCERQTSLTLKWLRDSFKK